MTLHAPDLGKSQGETPVAGPVPDPAAETAAARVPCVDVHFFTDTPAQAAEVERTISDRRMSRAQARSHSGGIGAAIEFYRKTATPNLLVLESREEGDALLAQLDVLATVCDADTKVIVIGPSNDIDLYRAVIRRGVGEYIRAPASPLTIISAIGGLYAEPAAAKLGRVYAFVGARGGSGSSTLAHNLAWILARHSGGDVLLADMDLAFGTADLDFDLKPQVGIAEVLRDPARLDDQMLERLLTTCDEHLSLLAAPVLLDSELGFEDGSFDALLDLAQASFAHVVLDVPHTWSEWTRRTLVAADEVVITATPDLASLRNARNLVQLLRKARPNDPDPRLVLNQMGIPKRPEIKVAQFAEVLKLKPLVSIPFDGRAFGMAATSGRMLPDVSRRGPYASILRQLAETLAGRPMSGRRRFAAFERLFSGRKPARARGTGR